MLEQVHSLTQRVSHADLSVQNIGNCDYVLDAPWSGLVLWAGCFEGCWLLLVVLCPLARVLVG